MLRSVFLYLSAAEWARKWIVRIGLTRRAVDRFVAGDTLADGLDAARRLNERGMGVSLDHLGESVSDEAGARQAVQAYLELLDAIHASGVRATVSLKLTQLGLDIDEALCVTNLRRILDKARETGGHITIDMESTAHTDATLRVFRTVRADYENVGIVIQAYLYRSEADLRALAAEGAFVRLCKGAYKEPPEHAFPDKSDVDANYVHLMKLYLGDEARANGAYLAIATHDEAMIAAARAYIKEHDVPYDAFEFQMLYGIRSKLQEQLRDDGFQVVVYVPYGTQWYPYYMRRLAERPANVWFILSNFFRR
ncbi:MAG TPA: proline dehydrogenase family protein [Aggregatilineaceae bacterium]|jgi:proline dehydrogenase|nr:proline dehydrogenase family protein [Anaerolineae bacterium]HMM29241.1 proline dehydrogenase family protein [Aggregatilineaceae bacterium]